jgi:hypothetical protein
MIYSEIQSSGGCNLRRPLCPRKLPRRPLTGASAEDHELDASNKMSSFFAVEQRLSGLIFYTVMALPRNTQSKTMMKMESANHSSTDGRCTLEADIRLQGNIGR